jgi:hypothetical protein
MLRTQAREPQAGRTLREDSMPIRVDAYTAGGIVSGTVEGAEHLRTQIEHAPELTVIEASWASLGGADPRSGGVATIPIDDLLIAVADEDPSTAVHASFHPISLEVGPYRIAGELPTLPGFDPGRALTRPSGEFVLLRDVRLDLADGSNEVPVICPYAFVNRYGVERVTADLMLGFFFPGAVMDGLPEPEPEATPGGPVVIVPTPDAAAPEAPGAEAEAEAAPA